MKKILIISCAAFFVLLAVITFMKIRAATTSSEKDADAKTAAEKERILRFWGIFREATEHRLAGRTKEAAEGYRRALELNGKHEDALYYLGNTCVELGDYQTAEESWRRLAEVNPHSARAHHQLGNLYLDFERKDFFNLDRAEAEFQNALRINQEETGPVLRLGHIALLRGDLPKARGYFDAVIATNFKSVEAHFLNGYVAWKNGEAAKAAQLFGAAVKFSEADKPVQGVLSEGDTKSGRSHPLPETPKRRTLFQPYFADLHDARQMQAGYKKLEAFLKQIGKLASQPATTTAVR